MTNRSSAELEPRLAKGLEGLWEMEQSGKTKTKKYREWYTAFVRMLDEYEMARYMEQTQIQLPLEVST